MKKLKFMGVMAMATLLLTSCLDGSNEQSLNGYAVVDFSMDAMGMVAYIDDYNAVYSPAFKDLDEGDCIFFTSIYSTDDPANDGSKKYATVTNAVVSNKLEKGEFLSRVDTANIMPGEITARDAAMLVYYQHSFTNHNYMFVGSSHEKVTPDQSNEYILQYDYDQEPEVVDGKRVYNFFLRVVKKTDGKGVSGTNTFGYVFPTNSYFKTLQSKETAEGNETLNIRFNYIKEFNTDSTAAKWEKSQIFQTQIPKENK